MYIFLIRHIYVSYPTYFLNNIFCSTTYYTKQHIFFNNIYMILNNICMSCNVIGNMYVMHRLTTYMWSLCNIFLHLSTAITPFVALSADKSVVQCVCQFIVSSKHLNCTISPLFFQRDDVFYLLCTRAWRMLLLRNTQRDLWHLGWYICLSVCVYVVNGITTPCLEGRHIAHVSIQQCGCLHVCLHTVGLWKTPRSLGGFGALFFLRVFTDAVHWLSLEHMGNPLLERCVANGKCASAVCGVRPELGTCSALSVGRVPRSLTLGWARGGVYISGLQATPTI